jgi:hypothetical protein
MPIEQTRLDSESNRALTLMAESLDGCTRAMMLGQGFPLALAATLIRAGLATEHKPERKRPGPQPVARLRITDAGRSALAQHERHYSTG